MAETATHTAELTMVEGFAGRILICPELSKEEYRGGLQSLHGHTSPLPATARSYEKSNVDDGTEYRVLVTGNTELERRAQLLVQGMRDIGIIIAIKDENLVA